MREMAKVVPWTISLLKDFPHFEDASSQSCRPPSNWTKLPVTEFPNENEVFPTRWCWFCPAPYFPNGTNTAAAFLGFSPFEWMCLVTRHLLQHHRAFSAKIPQQTYCLVSTHVPTLVPLGLHYLWPRLNNTYQDRVDLDMQMKVSIVSWFWRIKVYKHMIFETLMKANSTSEVTQT